MKQAVEFLYGIPKFTKKHSLAHTQHFMELLGNPGNRCKVIHVAGSNGKGSVCCFLYHMLLSEGKTVGLFTSPHLIDIRERFQINGTLCSEAQFLKAYAQVKKKAEELEEKGLGFPTFFEFIFAMGMVIFEEAQVEYVVLETGLGGRLDATNSFANPVLSIITSISLEHTEILGDTIAQIAGEKSGIIKSGVPVVFDANDPEASEVIRTHAKEMHSPCTALEKKMFRILEFKNNFIDFSLSTAYDKETRWTIPGAAEYQVENAALAILAMRVLQQQYPKELSGEKTEEQLHAGMKAAFWQGRMQEIAPEIYFDGAHNTSGIGMFTEAVNRLTANDKYRPLLLFSMVKEKDYSTSIDMLTADIFWEEMAVTTIPNERGISFEKLEKLFEYKLKEHSSGHRSSCVCEHSANAESECPIDAKLPIAGYADYREAFMAMKEKKKPGQKLFCTGSLYFIGALIEVWKENCDD
ncbi:folylpolyglutamate synthase/dihydrofolate synthase family protein [uncultured Eubacterium sp.]|uniref:bifunctional folylpolyglutamate synthase/dihydrofolate synthase n=1 Tax=uncultured Eubacterium sp. TaxID=165185 RepID=UPI0025EBECC9|nr:folylpolyglutamate synthase/dihydrofolate synthase family protein [uncultured Eubacterium sp.]